MPEYLSHFFAIGGFQGILLFFLLSVGGKNGTANRLLGVWCLFLGLFFLSIILHLQSELNAFSFLIGWSLYLPAGYGALLFLYCRHAINNKALTIHDSVHAIPLLSCYFLNLDLLLLSENAKLIWATSESPPSLSVSVSQLITYAQAFIYLGFSFTMVSRYQRQAKLALSDFNPEIFLWIWSLLFSALMVWTFKVISTYYKDLFVLSIISDFIIIFLIYGIALAQWRNPKLFKIDKIEELEPILDQVNGKLSGAVKDANTLDESTRNSILIAIKRYMEDETGFKNTQLNLLELSNATGVTTNNLSEVLNQQEGKNFYQFVNEYRVNHVCEQLKSDKSSRVLDLALAAGFSSKSTFNAVFKQFTGLSPTQYRNNHLSK